MFKKAMTTFAISFMLMMIVPIINVQAEARTVNDQEELKAALLDSDVTAITLGSDIETTEKINITRPITIDGNGHTIRYVGTFGADQSPNKTTWGGIYILQVYKTSATIKDIKLTGGNAAILVNGSTLRFEGNIDVSENGFGGIELAQGSGVDETSKLIIADNANIVNKTENANNPTFWVPEDSDDAVIEMNGITKTIESGEELTIAEVEKLFGIDSPKTGDSIIITLLLGLMGIGIFASTYKTIKQN